MRCNIPESIQPKCKDTQSKFFPPGINIVQAMNTSYVLALTDKMLPDKEALQVFIYFERLIGGKRPLSVLMFCPFSRRDIYGIRGITGML